MAIENSALKSQIKEALQAFRSGSARENALKLLNVLGYRSDRTLDLDGSPEAFLQQFDRDSDRPFRKDKALLDRWKSIDFLIQLTDTEVRNAGMQGELPFDSSTGYDGKTYSSYLFFVLELKKDHYTRTHLSQITREINRLFTMPVMVLFKQGGTLTLAVINRRISKRDPDKDVLKKVTLIKDIRIEDPHRAHIEILYDLSFPAICAKAQPSNFIELHAAWQKVLDTNALNKKFYRELANWYFWALDHVEFPADIEKDTATRNATSVIRLLTRLIFCWFLKEKGLIPPDLFSEHKLEDVLRSLAADKSTFYQAILQNLFFATLNQKMNIGKEVNRKFADDKDFQGKRYDYGVKNLYRYKDLFKDPANALKLFEDIPFLNGGLFDCLDIEDKAGRVQYGDGFTRNPRKQSRVPNFLFFSDYQTVDLSDAYGDKKKKKERLRGLINLLDSYKFTVTENTPIEEEIALDPELLGKVFENLLASYNPETGTTARKQTGSFYTPREIVNYMVDESIIAYLKGKLTTESTKNTDEKRVENRLRQLFAYTEESPEFTNVEVEILIKAIDECKILDPACGSGAFPMGILHKLVFILGKLDQHNERWKQKQIAKLDSVSMREELERTFRDNDDDYGRKLYLIENCIFGVDIQPIAIQISKLRFFISLICDQRTNKNKVQNCGVRPLPNLEIKFVSANTLLSLTREQKLLRNPEIDKKERDLEALRRQYFSAQSRSKKLKLQENDRAIRSKIFDLLKLDDWDDVAAHDAADWDPYDVTHSARFFDSEWMYGIRQGFDIIIGNPPYFNLSTVDKSFVKSLKSNFPLIHTGYNDIVYYFICKSINMLGSDGLCALITSNYYLGNEYAKLLRSFLVPHLVKVVNFKDYKVFSAASVHTCITFSQTKPTGENVQFLECVEDKTIANETFEKGMKSIVIARKKLGGDVWLLADPAATVIIKKIHQDVRLLGTIAEIEQGSKSGKNSVFSMTNEMAGDLKIEKILLRRTLKNSDIDAFVIRNRGICQIYTDNSTRIDEYPYAKAYLLKKKKELSRRNEVKQGLYPWYRFDRPRRKWIFDVAEKIVVPYRATSNRFAYDDKQYFNDGGDIRAIVITDSSYDCKYVLSLLNSTLLNWFFGFIGKPKGNSREYFNKPLSLIPIKDISKKSQQPYIELVDTILKRKLQNHDNDIADLQRQIDELVYSLYGLTEEEIAIVEGRE